MGIWLMDNIIGGVIDADDRSHVINEAKLHTYYHLTNTYCGQMYSQRHTYQR